MSKVESRKSKVESAITVSNNLKFIIQNLKYFSLANFAVN